MQQQGQQQRLACHMPPGGGKTMMLTCGSVEIATPPASYASYLSDSVGGGRTKP